MFTAFLPAISKKSVLRIKTEIRSWNLNGQIYKSLQDIAVDIEPIVRGWITYHSKFGKTEIGKEPCDGRLSSTVPWEGRGETPLHLLDY
ncbi:MAG: hypothetical protein GXZ19_01030 [Bacteroidales bacterium]|nr:hypothetical protein [Bacteroidales bacterium]